MTLHLPTLCPADVGTVTVQMADLHDPQCAFEVERFVAEQGGSVFHRPGWLLAVERGTGQAARGLMLWYRPTGAAEPQLAGWLPLTQVHSPFFGAALISSGFAVEGGVLAARASALAEVAHHLGKAAIELAQKLSCPVVELRGGSVPRGWERVSDKHSSFTAWLEGSDAAQLALIPRKHRAELRKALATDFTVMIGRDAAAMDVHYAVYAESVHRLGTPVFPKALFSAALDGLDADILTVFHHGEPVASVLSFYHNAAVMPFWGGGTTKARLLRANERMYFELMSHARGRGCTVFDFGRSKNGSGAWHYKRNWGFTPRPLTYARWTCPGAPPRDTDPTSSRHARRIALWKRLPASLANRFGPFIARGLA